MNSRDQTKSSVLSDGRCLAYAEYGHPRGQPVFLFHGTPGSRRWFLGSEPVAERLGLRLIATDRPGYGLSDPHPGRTLLDWAEDVAHLADALHLERFSVLGVSGGGPHAAACAFGLPERISLAVLVSSAAPPELMRFHNMAVGNRVGFFLAQHAPTLMRRLMTMSAHSFATDVPGGLAAMSQSLCAADQRVMAQADKRQETVMHIQEAYRAGIGGHVQDALLVSRPWGFDVRALRVPVQVWHGAEDTLVPAQAGEQLAQVIPGASWHLVPDTGHLLLDMPNQWERVLKAFANAMHPKQDRRGRT